MTSHNLFNKDYYEDGIQKNISLYENYRWLENETLKCIKSIINFADLKPVSLILDYGCAKGFYVHAFRLNGFDAYGFDISEYAITNCKPEVSDYLSTNINNLPKKYDFVLSKDVLEHINKNDLDNILKKIKEISDKCLLIIPLGDGNKYYFNDDNKDITHVIKEDIKWWTKELSKYFHIIKTTNCLSGIKEKQYNVDKNSTGFFLCISK